jgi:hypothetical protein
VKSLPAFSITQCQCAVIVKTRDPELIEKDCLVGGPILRREYQVHTTFVVTGRDFCTYPMSAGTSLREASPSFKAYNAAWVRLAR